MSDVRYDANAVSLLRESSVQQEGLAGLYRGVIASIDDPDRLGRVRVRVFALHGDKQRTPTTALPWAEVSEIGGGGHDYGSYNPPPSGSTVFVMFEMGHASNPVVMGTWRGIPERDEDNHNVMLTDDGLPEVEKAWLPPNGESETPKDVFDGVYKGDPHPTRRVWSKSYKGHTFVIEDGDGKEFLKIIDRAGQIIMMDCPVQVERSQGNVSQRGVRDAMRGDQLPHAIMKQRRASIRFKDLSGQEIVMDAADQAERIIIRSTTRGSATENKIVLSSGRGREFCEMSDSAGNFIRLDPNSDQPIQLKDKAGNAIYTDREKGQVCIVSAKETVATSQRESKVVQGLKVSDIRGDERKRIHGNKKTDIVGDLAVGALGNVISNIGGAIQMVVGNATGATKVPTPTSNAIDISIPLGSMRVNIKTAGSHLIDTTLGDVELSTVSGDAALLTAAGDADIGNLVAGAKYTASGAISAVAALTHELDGSTVHLGPTAGAINPLIKTLSFMPSWSAALSILSAGSAAALASVGTLPVPNPVTNMIAVSTLAATLQAYTALMLPMMVPANAAYFSKKAFNA